MVRDEEIRVRPVEDVEAGDRHAVRCASQQHLQVARHEALKIIHRVQATRLAPDQSADQGMQQRTHTRPQSRRREARGEGDEDRIVRQRQDGRADLGVPVRADVVEFVH